MRFLLVCLFFSTFWAMPAEAASSYLQPIKREWQTFLVAAGDQVTPKICGISNDFEDGTRLYFSGTAEGLSHVSVAFEQGGFDDHKTYKVRYNIPGVQSGEFMARFIEGLALVGEKAEKADFSQAFERVRKIEVMIEDQKALSFELTGIETALERYRECVGKKKQNPVITKIKPDVVTPASSINGRVPPPPVVQISSNEEVFVAPKPGRKPSFRPTPRVRYTEKLAREMKGDQDYMAVNVRKKKVYRGFLGPKTDILKSPDR